jgi:hypothetical protein
MIFFCIFWFFSTIQSYKKAEVEKKKLFQMEPEVKQQKLDDIPDGQTISIIWLDSSDNSDENIANQEQLRTFDPNLKMFKDDNECEKYIESQFGKPNIILIVNGVLGEKLVPRVHTFPQVISIYVFCWNKTQHEKWAKEFPKVFV